MTSPHFRAALIRLSYFDLMSSHSLEGQTWEVEMLATINSS
ncbi:hypothetical protein CUJ84_pRLN1000292 (plasmid) [Rhizobium leguminosarum]|uniref:Uncharacterized protein n=1 Tax=Rhizobium leguminosarum TaxID=384 RepID=A0A2K9ZC05_RHILE|nr:hypothetical protein CUJ84_pRLN1000292 [Rhizobium leguminosarum]